MFQTTFRTSFSIFQCPVNKICLRNVYLISRASKLGDIASRAGLTWFNQVFGLGFHYSVHTWLLKTAVRKRRAQGPEEFYSVLFNRKSLLLLSNYKTFLLCPIKVAKMGPVNPNRFLLPYLSILFRSQLPVLIQLNAHAMFKIQSANGDRLDLTRLSTSTTFQIQSDSYSISYWHAGLKVPINRCPTGNEFSLESDSDRDTVRQPSQASKPT